MSNFWSGWIIVLTLLVLVGNAWILLANRKTRNRGPNTTTGHVYDGIEEYDNPLPAWWFWGFVLTFLFAIGYLLAYPGLGSFKGLLGWTQVGQLEQELEAAQLRYGPIFDRYAQMPVEAVAQDPQALQMGQRLFANNCSQCHGVDARGSFGFPNLTDNDWLWGSEPEQIRETITNGRQGAMPGWETALGHQGVQDVTAYVLALSGRDAPSGDADSGEAHFQAFCATCHGVDGKGSILFGAPNLTDDIWLYGASPVWIQQAVRYGRNGVMPPFGENLDPAKIHLLVAYVYSLSQPQVDESTASR